MRSTRPAENHAVSGTLRRAGRWTDAQTFVLEYDGIASNEHLLWHMRFEGDRVEMSVQEITRTLGATFVGRQVKP